MKSVIFLGKRRKTGSPKSEWPDAELWGTTHSFTKYQKRLGPIDNWDGWFDLHPFDPTLMGGDPGGKLRVYPGIKAKRQETYRWYQSLPGPTSPAYRPLWLFELHPLIPAGVRFPLEDVLDAFPIAHGHHYTCQVDWMFGFALLRGYEHIILHGHGVSLEPTHMVAHRGILHWVTIARSRGATVTIVPPSWYIPPEQPYGLPARPVRAA